MKIKVMGRSGERLYECADVTVTYYTEATIAFRDAHASWCRDVEQAREVWSSANKRLLAAEDRIARSRRKADELHLKLAGRTNVVTWREWLSSLLPGRERETRKLRRDLAQAVSDSTREVQVVELLREQVSEARRRVDELEADEVTPGIELAMRMQNPRTIERVYLPQDGRVAYIMNDEGKTIDVKQWPMKPETVAKMEEASREAKAR